MGACENKNICVCIARPMLKHTWNSFQSVFPRLKYIQFSFVIYYRTESTRCQERFFFLLILFQFSEFYLMYFASFAFLVFTQFDLQNVTFFSQSYYCHHSFIYIFLTSAAINNFSASDFTHFSIPSFY